MARTIYVTATEWGVSYTSGSGIEGVELDVYRIVPRVPTADDPMRCAVEYAVKGMRFPNDEAASQYAFDRGYLKVYTGPTWDK